MQDQILGIVSEYSGVDNVKPEYHLREDLSMDSLDLVSLTLELEEKFEIEIPDQIADNVEIVKDIIDYIERVKR